MKRLFAITAVMLLSSAIFFIAVGEAGGPSAMTLKGRWSGIGYNVGQGNCPTGHVQGYVIAKGFMNLTGQSEWFSEGCTNLATFTSEGSAVVTTSDGDRLFVEYAITMSPPDATGAGTWSQNEDIIGGTGRFEGVTGSSSSGGPYQFIGTIDVWSGTTEGEIYF